MRSILERGGLRPSDLGELSIPPSRHACTEGGIEHAAMATASRCRRCYPRVASWFGARLTSCDHASSLGGMPAFAGKECEGVVSRTHSESTWALTFLSTYQTHAASSTHSAGPSPFHMQGTKPYRFPGPETPSGIRFNSQSLLLALKAMIVKEPLIEGEARGQHLLTKTLTMRSRTAQLRARPLLL